jgi:hypothetical protein
MPSVAHIALLLVNIRSRALTEQNILAMTNNTKGL